VNRVLAFAIVDKWPFPLPHSCGVYQDGKNASVSSGIVLKNNDTAVE
jgi:hypothetical protein